MRAAGWIALAGGVFFFGAIMVFTLFSGGNSSVTADEPAGRLVVATSAPSGAPEDIGDTIAAADMAAMFEGTLRAMSDRLSSAQDAVESNEAQANANAPAAEPDDEGCTTEVERGDGWERTTTVCVQQEVERDGNSVSVSTSTSTSTSTQRTD